MRGILDHNSGTPLYIQVEQMLRKLISQEEYRNGKKLPNEIEMSRQLGIARNTIRQAINKLVLEGLLERKKGYGTTVSTRMVSSVSSNWPSFSKEMATLGIKVKDYELHSSFVAASEELATFFGVKEGTKLLKLARLRGSEEKPIVYFISYFNPAIGISGVEDFSQPLYQILERDYSIKVKVSREEITAILSDDLLIEKFELNEIEPILKRKRFVYDVNSLPVEYNIGFYRANSFKYTIESVRE